MRTDLHLSNDIDVFPSSESFVKRKKKGFVPRVFTDHWHAFVLQRGAGGSSHRDFDRTRSRVCIKKKNNISIEYNNIMCV